MFASSSSWRFWSCSSGVFILQAFYFILIYVFYLLIRCPLSFYFILFLFLLADWSFFLFVLFYFNILDETRDDKQENERTEVESLL
ncbi:hypothetical protein DFH11DRAFT_1571654 [Phellopilus nigrolimitatus]|nr:hypothetical protein DFH11DRAFT_1571565 [Phellopilus nigrolimitatus]KAH8117964.1 hypothetical protein DFH11DRAFT_1571654 [Phellopilus nigrolimitatus]